MNRFRLLVGLLVLVVAAPTYALCVKCVQVQCWSTIGAGRSNCYSYGSSCLMSGAHCGSGGLDCDAAEGGFCEQALAEPESLDPLALDYKLAEVRVQQPKASPARIAHGGADTMKAR